MSGMGAVDNKRGSAALPVAALRSAVLPRAALPASGLWRSGGGGGYWPGGTPAAIRSACVLWYDMARQGCTNESMAADPTLRDLSGNGHDAECFNFAWSGMSGIGGYGQPLSSYNNIRTDRGTFEFDGLTTKIKSITLGTWQIYNAVTGNTAVAAQRIIVTGVPSGMQILYEKRDKDLTTTVLLNITEDGVYCIPQFNVDDIYGIEIKQTIADCDITIEQLPLYPNALVSDGVNDYAKAEGLPLLDKERGYTVIAKRKHLGSIQACLASRRNSGNPDGAFVFELKLSANSYRCDSFNKLTQLSAFEESDITCQTSQRYNDTAIGIGDAPDNGVLNLFVLYNSYFGKIALYSFLLFDRDLTAGEIAWVRENLLGDAPRLLLEDGGGISLEDGGGISLEGGGLRLLEG